MDTNAENGIRGWKLQYVILKTDSSLDLLGCNNYIIKNLQNEFLGVRFLFTSVYLHSVHIFPTKKFTLCPDESQQLSFAPIYSKTNS